MVARLKNGPGGGVEGVRAAPEHEAGHGVPVSEEGVQLGDPGGSVSLAALSLQQLLLHLAEVELSQAQPLLLHRLNVFLRCRQVPTGAKMYREVHRGTKMCQE